MPKIFILLANSHLMCVIAELSLALCLQKVNLSKLETAALLRYWRRFNLVCFEKLYRVARCIAIFADTSVTYIEKFRALERQMHTIK